MKSLLLLFIKSASLVSPLIIFGVMLCMLSACSMQKRRYRPGFYTDHVSAKPGNKKQPVRIQANSTAVSTVTQHIALPAPVADARSLEDQEVLPAQAQQRYPHTTVKKLKTFVTAVTPAMTGSPAAEELNADRKTIPISAILGFLFGIAAVLFGLFGLFFLLESASGLFVPAMLIFLILTVSAFVRSAMAIVQIAENPGEYRGLWMAIIGISLAALCFLAFGSAILYGDMF